MQHIEHDMDELFQKAAENYPLKTSYSDWDAIASRIKTNAPVAQPPVRSHHNWKKYFFTTLLLLIALLVADIILINNQHKITRKDMIAKEKSLPGTEKTTEVKRKFKTNIQADVILNEDKNKHDVKSLSNSVKTKYTKNHGIEDQLFETDVYSPVSIKYNSEKISKVNNTLFEIMNQNFKNEISLLNRNLPTLNINNNIRSISRKGEKGLYWGVLAGPQFSEVKQQGLTKSGFDAGIAVGYRFSKKISVESGLFYSMKYYYSEGKYFTMAKPDPSMPAGMTIIDLKGRSNVFEIPVKLRFDVSNNPKNKFFITGGISSYILTKEMNNYHTIISGTEQYMLKSYRNNAGYTAATVNFSAGVEHRIIKQRSIRIEPYLQIPVKGIGVGALNVTSAGIHIGIITNKKNK